MGLELAIDDFGMGYSSFGYLKRLKIDRLKIDKFLIASIGKDQNWEAIIIAIIALGHSLGLRVIAEGVESKGQLDFLRHHGCDEIQGFFISKPMNKEKTLIFIKNYKNSIW
jgi:EAL domain-containing protein (putative c-di-GMP-specific phosphodiesterase class I)